MSNPQRPHGLQPSRILCAWDFAGKSTGVRCHRCAEVSHCYFSLHFPDDMMWSIFSYAYLPSVYHLEKGMATHSSILAWESCGQRSLTGYSPWGCKELDRTEWLTHTHTHTHIHIIFDEDLSSLAHFLVDLFFYCWILKHSLYIFGCQSFIRYIFHKYFLPKV